MVDTTETDWLEVLRDDPLWVQDWRVEARLGVWQIRKGYADHDLWHVAMYMTGVMSEERVAKYRDYAKAFQVYVMNGWGLECNCKDRQKSPYSQTYPKNYKGQRYY